MEVLIAFAFGVLFIFAINIIVEKRKATVKKETNFKDGEAPKKNPE